MDINSCIARVWNNRGEICGAAFLVGEDRLLTCAQVVGKALNADLRCEEPPGDVLVDFPGAAPGKLIRAEAVAWQQDEQLDYVLLAALETLPPGTIPAHTVPVGRHIERRRMLAFGFPQGTDLCASVPGEAAQLDSRGWVRIEPVDQPGQLAQPGFNGGPVVDEAMDAVAGMLVASSDGGPAVAQVIPLGLIAGQWPQLLAECFLTIQRTWKAQTLEEPKIPTEPIASPLNDPWHRFLTKPGWHDRVGKKLADIARSGRAFAELGPLVQVVEAVDTTAGYEEILEKLRGINQQRDLARAVDELLARYERKTLLSAGQIRGIRYNPSPDEEKQMALDNIRQNLNDLRDTARNPEFGRCFFVMGGMGAGKTHFIEGDLQHGAAGPRNSASENCLVLPMRHMPVSAGFEPLLLANLRAASGIHWPDLALFSQFLDAYSAEFLTGHPARLVIAVDDLGHWEQMHPGFIEGMVATIRQTSQLHSIYWLVCSPYSNYSVVADQTALTPEFWTHYGDIRNPDLTYLDHWLVLDHLNWATSTGMEIIRQGLKKRADKDTVYAALTGAIEEGTQVPFNNPLVALAFLEQTRTQPVELAIHQNFITCIETYWKNQRGQPSIQPEALQALVLCAAHHLAELQGMLLPKIGLLQALAETSDPDQAAQVLHLLTMNRLLAEHHSEEPEIEMRAVSFWALELAKEIHARAASQMTQLDIETVFARLNPVLRGPALEFFLLLLDNQHAQANRSAALPYCDQVLSSTTLPYAPVWAAGAKGSPTMQKGLIERARAAPRRTMDGQSLISLLDFLCMLPVELLSVPERFAILQPLYSQIKPGNYAAYFYYRVQQMFDQLETTDELAISMVYLSGCEPTGLAEDLAELSLNTLLSFYDASGPSSAFLARWLLDYLVEVVEEYPDRESIPGQEKGWRRTLFREFVLNSFLRTLCRKERLNTYTLLNEVHWYDDRRLRTNPVLALQKEREANIAIGALFRYDSKEGFIKFATRLVESKNERDRRNAFFILRHSEHISEERPVPILDERFQPLLETLFLDSSLDRILQNKSYYELFRRNLRNFRSLEQQRGKMDGAA